MRYVSRSAIPEPEILRGRLASEYRRAVERYLASGERDRRPPQPPEPVLGDERLRQELFRLFWGACAYCETPLQDGGFNIDHYRPWQGADRGDGEVDFQYYCWLGLEWANLYPACNACLRAKRNFFPIRQRGGAEGDPRSAPLSAEGAMLLDPCFDAPAEHLILDGNGLLSGIDDRGATTIEVLSLNRPDLRHARLQVLRSLDLAPDRPLAPGQRRSSLVASAIADRVGFQGIILIRLVQGLPAGHPFRAWSRQELSPERAARLVEAVEQSASGGAGRDSATPSEVRAGERRYVRRVVIDGFRGIDHAVVEFPARGAGGGKGAGSIAVLGENAAGKTCLLQAVAIGAMGPTQAMEAGVVARWCLRDGVHRGRIGVQFFDTDDTNVVTFEEGDAVLGGHRRVPVTVLGYGAYRLPARGRLGERRRRADFRVHTLMEERFSVNGPFGLERHLAGREGASRAEDVARALNEMLTSAATALIERDGRLAIEEGGRRRRLTDLSSGFKSILSLGTDVMDVMYETWGSLSSAQVLLLVDEIDAHLHPEWRLRVVDAFRRAFPLSQLMLTTHDPLVLRGLSQEEVRLLDRSPDGSPTLSEPMIPSLDGLDVDQMLTSDLFGLRTTLRPEVDRDLAAYYRLLARPTPDGADDAELEEIRARLKPSLPMGRTRRERLLYEVIDRYLAKTAGERDPDVWDEEAVEQILDEFEAAEVAEAGEAS
ncbi:MULTISPECIES: AAA family ATPase [Alphaproteobacteria]|uniref:AAA family ATPase n=1 Tax=Alphaproteobacteria TaxID=28211 RepID=UPI002614E604|nr:MULTISPECIES: AAA family ATPase [Alphaproteobacteria]